MLKLQRIVSNFVLLLLVMLAFLLLFESQVEVPYWMQPLGRMHPMLLHFPIALIVVMVLLDLFKSQLDADSYQKVHTMGLNLTVLTTALSAIMGFLLSKEEGYSSELMELHKWVGVTVTYLIYLLLLVKPQASSYKLLLYGSFIMLLFVGHFGAGLTHGVDFLIEPIAGKETIEITEDTPIFQAFIDPVLKEKCKSCHNQQKHKGGLDMTTFDLLMLGGENGAVVKPGNALESEMVHRVLLPLAMEEHMPPEGKPQLTDFELDLLSAWIEAGADAALSLAQLNQEDTLFRLANLRYQELQQESAEPRYNFDFASEKLVASLNNPYRSVIQETPSSPALKVNLFVRQAYQKEYLEDLNKIKDQIVNLNLAYMPIKDQDLRLIGTFPNLETLNLNHTEITGDGLSSLAGCKNLKSLAIAGTSAGPQLANQITVFESLEELFIWNTGLSEAQVEELKKQNPGLTIRTGYTADQEAPIPLTSPQLKNSSTVLGTDEAVMLEHKLNGVIIRYTVDGTDPDSTASPQYLSPIPVEGFTRVKAVAYKAQWLTSDTVEYHIFSAGKTPVKVELMRQPNPQYPGNGPSTLIDKKKGIQSNFKGKEWLGFREEPFVGLVDFGEDPPEVKQVILSYGIRKGSHLMSPSSIKIWGGNDQGALQLLASKDLPADEQSSPDREEVVQIEIPPTRYRYYKIEGQPLDRLPSWHNAKGQPAWLFIDELFFY
jgi:uncharacterized membrane protein